MDTDFGTVMNVNAKVVGQEVNAEVSIESAYY